MLHRSTIQLLRFHFSLFLLPVYLFAISQAPEISIGRAILIFLVLHVLVYPSSNGYNSYMDRDTSAIGGLRKPLQPTRELFVVSVFMDIAAIALGLIIGWIFSLLVLVYIFASRAYSYRGIRLKQYPIAGYLTVILCQGALVFVIVYLGVSNAEMDEVPLVAAAAAALLIGGSYPLTQVYQHREDKADGVKTISMLLGVKGTFLFCAFIFLLATLALFFLYGERGVITHFYLFGICLLPVLVYFFIWMKKVWKNSEKADFVHSLRMNILASACMIIYFTILIIIRPS